MSKTIVVVGATGTQGGSVARRFAKLPEWKVRGITRNPSSANALELAGLGIEVVKADLDDVELLRAAFEGAAAIFGVTDFWQFVQAPSMQAMVKEKGITWNEAAYLQEVQQGKNIIDAATTVGDGLERLVLSSLADVKKATKGKYTWVYRFDSKAKFVQYLEEQAQTVPAYRALFDKTSYVQMGNYLDNWKKNPIFAPYKVSDGTAVFRAIAPTKMEVAPHPFPFVHPPHDTGVFVEGLLKAEPRTTLNGICSPMLESEYFGLWSETMGMPVRTEALSIEDCDKLWPGGFGQEVGEAVCFFVEFGADGGKGAVLPEQIGIRKEDLTDVKEYIKSQDWSATLNGTS